MPNHTTNYVAIVGGKQAMADLKQRVIKHEDNGVLFDFNGIIPMPEELRTTISPTTIVATQDEADRRNAGNTLVLDKMHPEMVRYISEAEAERRGKAYGTTRLSIGDPRILNWYDWATKYWGTKWNGYDADVLHEGDSILAVRFDTAWSAPTPIFDALKAQGFEVNAYSEYEGGETPDEYGEPYSYFDVETTVTYAGAQ